MSKSLMIGSEIASCSFHIIQQLCPATKHGCLFYTCFPLPLSSDKLIALFMHFGITKGILL